MCNATIEHAIRDTLELTADDALVFAVLSNNDGTLTIMAEWLDFHPARPRTRYEFLTIRS